MISKIFGWVFAPKPKDEPNTHPLVVHAQCELTLAGLFDEDSDYGGNVGEVVLDLVKTISGRGLSGSGHCMVMEIFNQVGNFKTLTLISDDPDEWMRVNPYDEEEGLWQNRRQSSVFSTDGGKTYYDIDEPWIGSEQPVHKSKDHARG